MIGFTNGNKTIVIPNIPTKIWNKSITCTTFQQWFSIRKQASYYFKKKKKKDVEDNVMGDLRQNVTFIFLSIYIPPGEYDSCANRGWTEEQPVNPMNEKNPLLLYIPFIFDIQQFWFGIVKGSQ